jgi:hypothetical protein
MSSEETLQTDTLELCLLGLSHQELDAIVNNPHLIEQLPQEVVTTISELHALTDPDVCMGNNERIMQQEDRWTINLESHHAITISLICAVARNQSDSPTEIV